MVINLKNFIFPLYIIIGQNSSVHYHRQNYQGRSDIKKMITDPNWENRETSFNGQWQGEFCDLCYSPEDCMWAHRCGMCYSAMLAKDICMKNFFFKRLNFA